MHVNPAEDSHECEAIFSMEMKENTKEALSLSKNINPSLVPVQPRNTHPTGGKPRNYHEIVLT